MPENQRPDAGGEVDQSSQIDRSPGADPDRQDEPGQEDACGGAQGVQCVDPAHAPAEVAGVDDDGLRDERKRCTHGHAGWCHGEKGEQQLNHGQPIEQAKKYCDNLVSSFFVNLTKPDFLVESLLIRMGHENHHYNYY